MAYSWRLRRVAAMFIIIIIGYMDSLSPEKRKWVMSQVKGKNTTPEKSVRSLLHRLGFRFRLHKRNLPGTPDIILPKYHSVIFVHGCFWHRHNCPNGQRLPKTNVDFWKNKLDNNAERDLRKLSELRTLGWKVLVVWECEVKDSHRLRNIILSFLRPEKDEKE